MVSVTCQSSAIVALQFSFRCRLREVRAMPTAVQGDNPEVAHCLAALVRKPGSCSLCTGETCPKEKDLAL
jgi:hypothetical protein